ncbi:MAG: hypothetical protein WC877_00575 [Dehalococcoidales bacterium]|jgi:hypothetical protein
MRLSSELSIAAEWKKWTKEIPFVNWPSEWEVKAIPPFGGSIIRYLVRLKQYPDHDISIYLDCYDELGVVGQPYWEIYPANEGDTYRCLMNDVDELITELWKALIAINELKPQDCLPEGYKLLAEEV